MHIASNNNNPHAKRLFTDVIAAVRAKIFFLDIVTIGWTAPPRSTSAQQEESIGPVEDVAEVVEVKRHLAETWPVGTTREGELLNYSSVYAVCVCNNTATKTTRTEIKY